MHKNFLCLKDCSADELNYLLRRGIKLKSRFKAGEVYRPFEGKVLAMLFEKASTRTRVSFEAGMAQLGGTSIYLSTSETQLKNEETIEDTARAVSRMVDLVMIRTGPHSRLEAFAKESEVPVINGLTNDSHPCQVMGDIMNFIEKRGSIKGAVVTWIGDANNVLYSWLYAASILGFKVHISAPPGYSINPTQVPDNDDCYDFFLSPEEAAEGADLVTTDNWRSCGYDENQAKRQSKSARWQVNETVMKAAKPDALFMHCLPAFRGQEVSSEVIDGPQSVVWDEAENRLHFQKALMEYLLLGRIEDV
ncbi:ornithine carbamoyltransferase [Parasutterella excrementihominis]|uniref:ornithine carbamoyltransferase n=1 Tax=Parasutterella excrementihominis TaxID=487175 RepID=UPI00248C9C0A|nr:ornithine carbamoyltransferase [Parasutterella excrementihominis]